VRPAASKTLREFAAGAHRHRGAHASLATMPDKQSKLLARAGRSIVRIEVGRTDIRRHELHAVCTVSGNYCPNCKVMCSRERVRERERE
jgi:hypothetical protein